MIETSSLRGYVFTPSSGCLDLGRQHLAELVAMNPCGAERIPVLVPKPVIARSPKRPFHVGVHLLARGHD
jgi:hypothetical protein